MNKKLIHSRFEKHLKDYDENAKIQKVMAERLISLCSKKQYKNVLEIGCGTGFLTAFANKKFEFDNYTAIDIVDDCEEYVKAINPKIHFINADIEDFEIDFAPDLIISNASLQWLDRFLDTISRLANSLNIGGEFVFSTFGKENYREFLYITGASLNYYSDFELKKMFPNATIYPPEIHIMSFESPKDVLRHMQLTGVNAIENKSWTKTDLKKFEQEYTSICGNRITLTYNPVYIKINK